MNKSSLMSVPDSPVTDGAPTMSPTPHKLPTTPSAAPHMPSQIRKVSANQTCVFRELIHGEQR